jgi:V/A-type H+-transporting ATPase subunit F
MSDKKMRMGAVGEEDVILAFKAIGAVALPAVTPEQITAALHRLHQDGVPVVFITEQAARMVPETMARYDQTPEMAVIPIPGIKGSDGYGAARVRDNVIKAIGADILI